MNECDELTLTPPDIKEAARAVIEKLLPPKSKEKYLKTYENVVQILLTSSSVAVGLCLFGLGILLHTSIAPPWVTAVLILCYCFAFMFGAGSVPYVLLAECFVSEVQSIASILLLEWVWLLNFLVIGIFPFMIKLFGIHGSFYIFACFAVLDVFVGLFVLPETKGLTNEQIQEEFLRVR